MTANVGAKYGSNPKSEQSLVLDVLHYVEEPMLIVGDRNYGTFRMAKEFRDAGANCLMRLSKPVANALAGGSSLKNGLDKKVIWRPSSDVKKKYSYNDNEQVEGRLIVKTIKYKNELITYYLFTNLKEGSIEELVELYKKRWHIEEDIKSMKMKLKLKQVQAEKKATVDVEIFCKLLAYNITRAVILMAVDGTGIDPRRISFARALLITRKGLTRYEMCKTKKDKLIALEDMCEKIRLALIPYRPGRSHPR